MGLVWQKSNTVTTSLEKLVDSGSCKKKKVFLNGTLFTCSVTPGNFIRIRWSHSLILVIYSSAPRNLASHSYHVLELPQISLGFLAWVKMDGDQIVGGGGSRKQMPSRMIHPNGKTEVGSGGAGSHPNRVRGRDPFYFQFRFLLCLLSFMLAYSSPKLGVKFHLSPWLCAGSSTWSHILAYKSY